VEVDALNPAPSHAVPVPGLLVGTGRHSGLQASAMRGKRAAGARVSWRVCVLRRPAMLCAMCRRSRMLQVLQSYSSGTYSLPSPGRTRWPARVEEAQQPGLEHDNVPGSLCSVEGLFPMQAVPAFFK